MGNKKSDVTLGEILRIYRMPMSLRLLFLMTAISLTIGYVFNLAQIMVHHHDNNGGGFLGVSPESIRAAYYGKRDASTLELKLDGAMGRYVTPEEKSAIIFWIRNGSNEELYHTQVRDMFERNCVLCHSAHSFRSLASFEDVKKVTQINRGMGLETLVRVSHIHFNGMTALFFMSGLITCFASIRVGGWRWVKWVVIVLPMAAMIADILS
ncbi:MAG: hypothetical protein AAB581_03845 [Patescibacteria group bacterium]